LKSLIALFCLIPGLLFAGTTGKITGRITDASSREPLLGVNVFILNTSMGASTDPNGNYVILNIPPGTYSIKISYVGYDAVIIHDVKVVVDRNTQISRELNPTELEMKELVVEAERPMIQKDLTSTMSVVSRENIEALPVANFSELLTLQAGVVGSGDNIHVRGGRTNEVAYMVDGMLVQDPLLGGMAANISNDAIEEMTLLSGTFNAEYGNALSGVVNIVTRDGGEKLGGKFETRTSEFGIKRYSDLEERFFTGNLNGPLLTPDLRFFATAEHQAKGSYLPFGSSKSSTGFFKLSYLGLEGMKLTFSNRGSIENRKPYSHAYKYIPDQFLQIDKDSWQSAFTFTHTVLNNLFYDIRMSYFNQGYYSGVHKKPSDYVATTEREYFADRGTGFEFYSKADPPEEIDSRTATADGKIDVTWQADDVHELKTGFQYKQHWLKYDYIYDPKRDYPYKNDYDTRPFEASGYIQDKIEFPYLILNLGLRYDYMNGNVKYRENPLDTLSKTVTVKSRSQFSPRIGISHPISENTKIHFAYGHFFQFPDYEYFYENSQYDLKVREPIFGQPNLDAERTITYEFGISHQFNETTALHATLYYKDVTGNIGTQYFFPYVDGRYTGYTLYVNEAYSNIKGLELTFDSRLNPYFSYGFDYTYSVAKGSASSETETYPGTDEATLLFYLNFDQTHVFNANASFRLPEGEGPEWRGIRLFENTDANLVLRASSGFPYTPSGRDVGFVNKNSQRMPYSYTVDLDFGKEFTIKGGSKLRVFAEIMNLTDRRNVVYVYGDTGEPDVSYEGAPSKEYMEDPSNFGPPRSVRLGMTVTF